jgi:hypothetical protein
LQDVTSWGADPRAFFSGDSFLYTSKEKSYPLLRRRSGSSGSKEEDEAKTLDSGVAGMRSRELRAPPQEEWKLWLYKDKQQQKPRHWIPAFAGMTSEEG